MNVTAKTAITGALAAAAVVTGAGAAFAQNPISNWSDAYYNYGGAYVGTTDCMVHAAIPKAGTATAYGQVMCKTRHTKTTIDVVLNVTTPTGVVSVSSGTKSWTNSFGTTTDPSRWVTAGPLTCNPKNLYQSVVSVTVDNVAQRATTGTPKHLC